MCVITTSEVESTLEVEFFATTRHFYLGPMEARFGPKIFDFKQHCHLSEDTEGGSSSEEEVEVEHVERKSQETESEPESEQEHEIHPPAQVLKDMTKRLDNWARLQNGKSSLMMPQHPSEVKRYSFHSMNEDKGQALRAASREPCLPTSSIGRFRASDCLVLFLIGSASNFEGR